MKTSTKKITWEKTHRYRVANSSSQRRQSIDQRVNSSSEFEKSFHENSLLFERYEKISKRIVNRFLKYICTERARSAKITDVLARRLLVCVVENSFFFMFFSFSSDVFFIITSASESSKIFVRIASRRRATSFRSRFRITFPRSGLMMSISKFFNSLKRAMISRCASFFFSWRTLFFFSSFSM